MEIGGSGNTESKDLVYIDQYGLLGSNFYWHKYEAKGITKEEILSVGLTNDRVQVHKDLIDILVEIDKKFQSEMGCRLYIKEGYRSVALYELVYRKRVIKFGKEETDKLLNMKDMPHSTGKAVDVTLFRMADNKEVMMRRYEDGAGALIADFYKDATDEEGKKYQALQRYVIEMMQSYGFHLGKLREYFHFNYGPDMPGAVE